MLEEGAEIFYANQLLVRSRELDAAGFRISGMHSTSQRHQLATTMAADTSTG